MILQIKNKHIAYNTGQFLSLSKYKNKRILTFKTSYNSMVTVWDLEDLKEFIESI